MREIKFRGKRLDNGNWVYGDLRQENSGRKVIMTNLNTWGDNADDIEPYGEDVYVNTETVGQFTGILDKNGKEIYEGDIVQWQECVADYTFITQKSEVFYSAASFEPLNEFSYCYFEVIGNIYDNPELLK